MIKKLLFSRLKLILISVFIFFLGAASLLINSFLKESLSLITVFFVLAFLAVIFFIFWHSVASIEIRNQFLVVSNFSGKCYNFEKNNRIKLSVFGFFIFKTTEISCDNQKAVIFNFLYNKNELIDFYGFFKSFN